jgi:hypothetical protein
VKRHFDSLALPHDNERSRAIAWWAYEQGEAAGAHAWIDDDRLMRLRLVAEPPPPDYPPRDR